MRRWNDNTLSCIEIAEEDAHGIPLVTTSAEVDFVLSHFARRSNSPRHVPTESPSPAEKIPAVLAHEVYEDPPHGWIEPNCQPFKVLPLRDAAPSNVRSPDGDGSSACELFTLGVPDPYGNVAYAYNAAASAHATGHALLGNPVVEPGASVGGHYTTSATLTRAGAIASIAAAPRSRMSPPNHGPSRQESHARLGRSASVTARRART